MASAAHSVLNSPRSIQLQRALKGCGSHNGDEAPIGTQGALLALFTCSADVRRDE